MNPYIPLNDYTPDGEPHVFDDRVYIYTSHDQERGTTFCALDYVVYSAPLSDLNSWTNKGIAYRASQDPLCTSENTKMYAPDCVRGKGGRYYLYYCLSGVQGKGGYSNPICVAVSSEPDTGFEYYGTVRHKDGSVFMDCVNFDPAVMNDDGTVRLYFGAYYPFESYHLPKALKKKIYTGIFGKADPKMGAFNVELEDDMLTVAGEIHETVTEEQEMGEFTAHPFFEASSIRKVNGKYCFIYSSWYNHELCYALSDRPDTGFHFCGTIVSNGDVGINGRTLNNPACPIGNNHGSIENINKEWYVFYHRQTHNTSYSRQACVEKIAVNQDGTIPQVEMTSLGFEDQLKPEGVTPAVIACMLTNGRSKLIRNGSSTGKNPFIFSDEKEQFIHRINRGTRIGYKYFAFEGKNKLSLIVRGEAKGKLQVYADETLLTEIPIDLNSKDWKEAACEFSANGRKALYLKFSGRGSFDLKELKWN